MTRWLVIALGGAIGALARYAVAGGAQRWAGGLFPVGTLTVNALGCLAIGILWVAFEHSSASPELRAMVLVGGLGAFTTFSTFGFETMQLVRDGELKLAAFNVLANNGLGFAMVLAGMAIGRKWLVA